ncbi:MAG: segregation/condensation protein A [Candidatus Kapaibacteriales bacterium]
MSYKLDLPIFEGPFELLLYFIRRDEIDIYDIPISRITTEFLEYVNIIKEIELEMAGDFVLMASQLMYIKSQMLLPREPMEDGEEIEDPRSGIVQSLLEYQRYKEAAEEMRALSDKNSFILFRQHRDAEKSMVAENELYKNATFIDLIKAYKKMHDRLSEKKIDSHVIRFSPVTIEEQSKFIRLSLKSKKNISFTNLVKDYNKLNLVVTFLAILELIKHQEIIIVQSDNFDDIFISSKPIADREVEV